MKRHWQLLSVVLLVISLLSPPSFGQDATAGGVQFAPAVLLHYPGSYPQAIASGDFTNNGLQDLIAGDEFGGVYVKLGRGNGTFGGWRYVSFPGHNVSAMALGKFDGRNLDAVVNDIYGAWVLLGDGKGNFPSYTYLDTGGGNHVAGFAVGDFNGDGKQDIAALVDIPGQNSDSSVVYLFLGNGDGTFQSPRQVPGSPLGPVAILAGDFNGDGKLDLVVLSSYLHDHVGRISVLLGDGKGRFSNPVIFHLHALYAKYPVAMASGNLRGAKNVDLALAYADEDTNRSSVVEILLGNGDGTFNEGARALAGTDPVAVAIADFNGDGIQDLVVANSPCYKACDYPSSISVLLGDGDGTFQPPDRFPMHGHTALQLTVADFSGDGKPDVATVNVNSQNVSVLLNTSQFLMPEAKPAHSQGY